MKGSLSQELDVGLLAGEVWEIYGSLQLAKLVTELLPNILEKFEVEQGDGGVGTILRLVFPAGTEGLQSYKEKFVKIDDKARIKEAVVVEGGYLTLGFLSYLVRFQVIAKSKETSAIRSTIEYEINGADAAKASLVTIAPLEAIAGAISKYLIEKKSHADKPI